MLSEMVFAPAQNDLSGRTGLEGHRLSFCKTDGQQRELHLSGTWTCLCVEKPDDYAFLIEQMDSLPEVLILPQEGGLIGSLDIEQNFALALHYNQPDFDQHDRLHYEELAAHIFRAAGLDDAACEQLGKALPLALKRMERWLAGYVRALLLAPELLVIEQPLAGLNKQEAAQICAWLQLFPLYHPFRHALILDLNEDTLPLLDNSTIEHM